MGIIAGVFIFSELLFLYQMLVNFRFVLKKSARKLGNYRPRAAMIIPCKGIDEAFELNIISAYYQDYDNYVLYFVVEAADDPAYAKLCELREKFSIGSKALGVQVLVAGKASGCGQKIHNLLHCIEQLGDDIEVMAFADSDAYLRSDWLRRIIHPLRQEKTGVSTGYRWFVPIVNNTATLALSAINAKIAQLLGSYRFNQAWGGSMAVRRDVFESLGVAKVWSEALSDDYTLSYLVKKAGKKIAYVPACLVASYEKTTWHAFFEFARRQFLITRVTMPWTWAFGLFASTHAVTGLYGFGSAAIVLFLNGQKSWLWAAAVFMTFLLTQLVLATARQAVIIKLLPNEEEKLKCAKWFDIVLSPVLSVILWAVIISSAFGRTIKWRGIKYKLLGPTRTVIAQAPEI